MTTYILVLWTVVAQNNYTAARDWRPIAEFQTQALCETAATNLNVKDRYRCIRTK